MLATLVITCQNKVVGNSAFSYTTSCNHCISSADEYRRCKTTVMEDIFAKIFAMTDCKVVSETYITSYRNKIKKVIWKSFVIP